MITLIGQLLGRSGSVAVSGSLELSPGAKERMGDLQQGVKHVEEKNARETVAAYGLKL